MSAAPRAPGGAQAGGFWDRILGCCGPRRPQETLRTVLVNEPQDPKHAGYASNFTRTTKYTLLTFLPVALFEQVGSWLRCCRPAAGQGGPEVAQTGPAPCRAAAAVLPPGQHLLHHRGRAVADGLLACQVQCWHRLRAGMRRAACRAAPPMPRPACLHALAAEHGRHGCRSSSCWACPWSRRAWRTSGAGARCMGGRTHARMSNATNSTSIPVVQNCTSAHATRTHVHTRAGGTGRTRR